MDIPLKRKHLTPISKTDPKPLRQYRSTDKCTYHIISCNFSIQVPVQSHLVPPSRYRRRLGRVSNVAFYVHSSFPSISISWLSFCACFKNMAVFSRLILLYGCIDSVLYRGFSCLSASVYRLRFLEWLYHEEKYFSVSERRVFLQKFRIEQQLSSHNWNRYGFPLCEFEFQNLGYVIQGYQ